MRERPHILLYCAGVSPAKFHGAACALDGRDRRFGGRRDLEGELCLQLALAEDLDAVARPGDDAGRKQRLDRHRRAGVELAGVERLLNAPEIDFVVVGRKRIVESALRQAPMQRHLTALEALDRHAGARLLALDAAAGRLALARADAAPDRTRFLLAPGLSVISLSFMAASSLPVDGFGVDDFHEMRHLSDHPAHGRRVFQRAAAADARQAEAKKRTALPFGTADRAADLFDDDLLRALRHGSSPYASTASASTP
jgi:hypothetical protein